MTYTLAAMLLTTVTSLLMTGVIWFVQVVHYPLFRLIGRSAFPYYEENHMRRTGWVVIPLMTLELGSALVLPFLELPPEYTAPAWLSAALAVLIWSVTFTVQVPLHRRLTENYEIGSIQKLVRTNAVRVFLWSGRSVLVTYMLVGMLT